MTNDNIWNTIIALRDAAPSVEREYCSPYGALMNTAADMIEELQKSLDEEIARNRPLHSLIASLEETKSYLLSERIKWQESIKTLESEREMNAKLTEELESLKS